MQIKDILGSKAIERCQNVAKKSEYLKKRASKSNARRTELHFCAFR